MRRPFGRKFDYNKNGKTDPFELALDFMIYDDIVREDEEDEELENAGLDRLDLFLMSAKERKEALEDAELDEDDFDDDIFDDDII